MEKSAVRSRKMKFSVLMSVYGKEKPEYLKESLNSLLCQTRLPDQVVMVEDGPLTEGLYQVLDEYEKRFSDFKRVVNQQNLGLGKALEKGLLACDHPLVARMDTDDIAFPDRFAVELKEFEEDPELDICGSHTEEFEGDISHVVSIKKVPLTNEEIRRYAKKRNPFNHPTEMLKKSAVLAAGNYQHALGFEDYYLWVRMLQNGAKGKNIDRCLLHFRAGADMFKRRGGVKYIKNAVSVKWMFYQTGFLSFWEFLCYSAAHTAVSLMPNSLRSAVYTKFLRSKG